MDGLPRHSLPVAAAHDEVVTLDRLGALGVAVEVGAVEVQRLDEAGLDEVVRTVFPVASSAMRPRMMYPALRYWYSVPGSAMGVLREDVVDELLIGRRADQIEIELRTDRSRARAASATVIFEPFGAVRNQVSMVFSSDSTPSWSSCMINAAVKSFVMLPM